MYKRQETFDKSIRLFIYFSAIVQLALGLFWLVKNLTVYNPDLMSESYIQASKSLVVDDYMGILYAVFLKCFSWSKNGLGISILTLYICQMMILGACIYTFVGTFFGPKLTRLERAAIVITGLFNPLSIQACCFVSPSALILSFILCVMVCIYSYNESGKNIHAILLGFSSIVLVFLINDIGYVLAVIFLVMGIIQIKKKRGKALVYLGLSIAMVLCLFMNHSICVPYYYNRGRRSFWALAVQRVNWNTIRGYDAEIPQRFGFGFMKELMEANQSPAALFTSYFYNLEGKIPYKEATRYYRFIVLRELSINTRFVVSNFFRDFVLYAAPMLGVLRVYMFGVSDTLVSHALTIFTREWHSLFLTFFSFYAMFSVVACILCIGKLVISREVKKYRATIAGIILACLAVATYNTTATLRGFDYRNSVAVVVICNLIFLGYLLTDKDKA